MSWGLAVENLIRKRKDFPPLHLFSDDDEIEAPKSPFLRTPSEKRAAAGMASSAKATAIRKAIDDRLYATIIRLESATIKQLMEEMDMSNTALSKRLTRLSENLVIEKVSRGSKTFWRMAK